MSSLEPGRSRDFYLFEGLGKNNHDLHEADQPSLLMLGFIARQLKESRLLLIGSYREVEVRNSPVLSRLIGEIAREGHQILLGLNLAKAEISAR